MLIRRQATKATHGCPKERSLIRHPESFRDVVREDVKIIGNSDLSAKHAGGPGPGGPIVLAQDGNGFACFADDDLLPLEDTIQQGGKLCFGFRDVHRDHQPSSRVS